MLKLDEEIGKLIERNRLIQATEEAYQLDLLKYVRDGMHIPQSNSAVSDNVIHSTESIGDDLFDDMF